MILAITVQNGVGRREREKRRQRETSLLTVALLLDQLIMRKGVLIYSIGEIKKSMYSRPKKSKVIGKLRS